jgi:glutathione synthase/RimK-type ligase-like ATP-grasp enzyme
MMKLLCIANPNAYQHAITDVSLSYARLAAHPDVELYHTETTAMMGMDSRINAVAIQAGFMPDEFRTLPTRASVMMEANDFDIAFCRTLKPFPTGYLDRLAQWSQYVPFVNDPSGISRQLDVGFLLEAAGQYTPSAVVTNEQDIAQRFLNEHGTMVVKQSNSCGGRGVYKISTDPQGDFATDNVTEGPRTFHSFSGMFLYVTKGSSEQVLLMSYLPRVTEGDRRLVVMDGEIFGTYIRRSKSGHWVQNVSFGSTCDLMPVTEEDRRMVEATAPYYQQAGIRLLGYDLLLDNSGTWKISEINAGNIGGLFRLEYLGVKGVSDRFVDKLRTRNGNRQATQFSQSGKAHTTVHVK